MLVEYSVTVDTTGPAGQASGRGSLVVDGEARRTSLIEWISFVFADEAPSTTEVSLVFTRAPEVSLVFTRAPEGSGVFRLTNHPAGEPACPRKQAVDAAGNAVVGSAIRLPAASFEVEVAKCDPMPAAVTVTMCVRRR